MSVYRLGRTRRCRRWRVEIVCALLVLVCCESACSAQSRVTPSQEVEVASRYAKALFIDRNCARVRRLVINNAGSGCAFFSDFPLEAIYVVSGDRGYYRHCPDLTTGGAADASPCAWLTLVSHPSASEWSTGVLEVWVARRGSDLLVANVAYGNGENCSGTSVDCQDVAHLWSGRMS
jgi:hypothetical protein